MRLFSGRVSSGKDPMMNSVAQEWKAVWHPLSTMQYPFREWTALHPDVLYYNNNSRSTDPLSPASRDHWPDPLLHPPALQNGGRNPDCFAGIPRPIARGYPVF